MFAGRNQEADSTDQVGARQPAGATTVLRWIALGAAAAILHLSGPPEPVTTLFVVLLLCSVPALYLLPAVWLRHPRFEMTLFLTDVILITLGFLVVIPGESILPASFFLGILIAVLASGSAGWALAGLAVPGLYLALGSASSSGPGIGGIGFALRIVFLLASSYYFLLAIRRLNAEAAIVDRARRESRELWTLLQITETITGTLDLKRVMSLIVQKVGELVGAESCSILLTDAKLRNCFVLASSESPDVDMLEVDLQKYPELRRALDTREPVLVTDVQRDPLVSSVRDILIEKGYRSMLVLPLLFGREVLGTLFLRASRGRPFSRAEIRFCRAAAGASANALKNALLYKDLSREAELHRATGETLRRVLDCSPDMIIATDTEGRVTEFNGGAEKITRIGEDRARGADLGVILGTGVLASSASPPEEGVLRQDVELETGAGETLEISLVSAPLVGTDDERAGRVWIGRDMTHVRRVERSLAQAERLSTLGEVVAGVAHELNNPLSAVLGYSELLRKNREGEGELRDLERVVDSARRCKRIVRNLLSFARKHTPEKNYQDLNSCVQKVLDLTTYNLRSLQIEVDTELDPDLPETLFDYHQIEQVVMNLVTNAEQALQSAEEPRRLIVRTCRQGSSVVLEVEDSGPGIPDDIRGRIFDPFFTTKGIGNGTGLGLSLSYGIVQEHQGRLEVLAPRPGSGAAFRMTLPLVEAPGESEATEPVTAAETAGPLEGTRILVAEDEPTVLDLFTRVLRQEGADVTCAKDGEEAWEKLTTSDYDLVVADVRMPRLDGQELYERVAENRPELLRRFVFSTGDLMRQETVAFLQGQPNGIIAKPLQVETVRHVLGRTLAALR
jgi:two-component system NtrC family sensor kinase